MSALVQLREVIDASLDDDGFPQGDRGAMATRLLDEASTIGLMALGAAEEIANDPSISPAEAARQAAMVAEETASAAARLESRLALLHSLA